MKIILVIFCGIVAITNANPLTTDSTNEAITTEFDSNGPQPVDEVVALANDGDENPSKRVARHYGFGGVSIGVVVPSYSYAYPVYGGYGGGYGGYGGGWGGGYGGYGGGWGGYGGGWGGGYGRHHHHHHHRHW